MDSHDSRARAISWPQPHHSQYSTDWKPGGLKTRRTETRALDGLLQKGPPHQADDERIQISVHVSNFILNEKTLEWDHEFQVFTWLRSKVSSLARLTLTKTHWISTNLRKTLKKNCKFFQCLPGSESISRNFRYCKVGSSWLFQCLPGSGRITEFLQ